MKQYLNLMQKVLDEGQKKSDRTGTGTLSIFGHQMEFDLSKGFPLVTTKKVHLKSIVHELIWFLQGSTNISYLKENGVSIWDEWADENGDLGPVYGAQWRSWPDGNNGTIDQIQNLIQGIKTNPDSRRHIVSAWNPALVDEMALPPCHSLFQFYVADGELSCQLYQRSADIFLGVPFNIASYALLTHMVAHVCNLKARKFVHTFGDAHLYLNHLEQAKLQLSRDTKLLPQLKLNSDVKNIFDFKFEDIEIINYESHPSITIVAAIASNNVIGQKNSLPWDIPEDLKRFKQLTSGHTILMGRKTFDSIGRPLPNRTNIVMTKDTNYQKEGIEIVFDENEALDLIKNLNKKVFIIGGSKIYKLFEPLASSLMITRVLKDFEGDAFFPDIDWNNWQIENKEEFLDEKSGISCRLEEYLRKS